MLQGYRPQGGMPGAYVARPQNSKALVWQATMEMWALTRSQSGGGYGDIKSGAEAFSPGSSGAMLHRAPRFLGSLTVFICLDQKENRFLHRKNLKQIQQDLCWPTPLFSCICLQPLLSQWAIIPFSSLSSLSCHLHIFLWGQHIPLPPSKAQFCLLKPTAGISDLRATRVLYH